MSGGYDVTHTIGPASIITDSDRPHLSGANAVDPPNLPAGDSGVFNKGEDLSLGAAHRWDSSRQVRQKVLNPDGLDFTRWPGDIKYYTTYANYPSDGVCGNDDQATADEDNDPYNAPDQGKLVGEDEPAQPAPHSEGDLDNTCEFRCHFRGFARLELGSNWYRISEWYLWRVHLKFRKQNESEATWGLDFNGDGDTSDTVPIWRDNGSSQALDNSGF